MEHEQIIEGNKLIAEFMGGRYERIEQLTYEPKGRWVNIEGAKFSSVTHPQDYNLRYHLSWDWLMTVVGKIVSLPGYENAMMYERLTLTLHYVEILMTWSAAVDFIKWYNEQSTTAAIPANI